MLLPQSVRLNECFKTWMKAKVCPWVKKCKESLEKRNTMRKWPYAKVGKVWRQQSPLDNMLDFQLRRIGCFTAWKIFVFRVFLVRIFPNSDWIRILTKSNTPPWVFFTFFKLCKGYQIAQRITTRVLNNLAHSNLGSFGKHIYFPVTRS